MMKTGTLLTKWTAALLAAVLMIFLFAIPAFAETESTAGTTEEVTSGETSTEASTESSTEASTEASTAEKETKEEETTAGTTTDKKDEGLSTPAIVWIIIGCIAVVAGAVVYILPKTREKIQKFLRVYKSECKKVVWLSWDQTKKNTLVVIIILVLCAAAICLIDVGLNHGVLAFIDLFK